MPIDYLAQPQDEDLSGYGTSPIAEQPPAQRNSFLDYLQNFMKPGAAIRPGFAQQSPGGYKPAENTTNKSAQSAALQAGMASSGLCGSGGGAAAGGL